MANNLRNQLLAYHAAQQWHEACAEAIRTGKRFYFTW